MYKVQKRFKILKQIKKNPDKISLNRFKKTIHLQNMEKFGLNLSFPLQEKRCSQLRQFLHIPNKSTWFRSDLYLAHNKHLKVLAHSNLELFAPDISLTVMFFNFPCFFYFGDGFI